MRRTLIRGEWAARILDGRTLTRAGPDGEGREMAAYITLDPLVPIGRVKAWTLVLCGPGDTCGNPLIGTRYDPMVRERIKAARRHARVVRRELRRMSPRGIYEPLDPPITPTDPQDLEIGRARALAVAETRPAWASPDRRVSRAVV